MIVQQLVARGLPVLAAARSEEKLAELKDRFPGIECAVADIGDPPALADAASSCSLLITSVGPYSKFGDVAAEAALTAGIPYIDITGEPAWLAKMFGDYSARAASAQVAMLPAFGYDYVPGNLAGALLLEQCGEAAVSVDIGYFLEGENRRSTEFFSQGTLDSLEASSGARPMTFSGGRLREVEGPRRSHHFDLDGQPVSAVAIGGSEHFALPRLAPWLDDVNVGLGWFQPGGSARDEPGGSAREQSGPSEGPSEQQRERARARILAIARDADGHDLAEVQLEGPNPYDLSGLLCAWAADRILGGEDLPSGTLGPVEAFGLEQLRAGCAESGLMVRG